VPRPVSWLRSIEVVESPKDFLDDRCVGVGLDRRHIPTMSHLVHWNHHTIEGFSDNPFRLASPYHFRGISGNGPSAVRRPNNAVNTALLTVDGLINECVRGT
jgi:hypothetical protein